MNTETESTTPVDPHAATLATLARVLGDGVFTERGSETTYDSSWPPIGCWSCFGLSKISVASRCSPSWAEPTILAIPVAPEPRFEVHYVVRNLETAEFVVIKVGVDDPEPTVPSVVHLWLGANWMEREVFDMYGIKFAGHPDLRRILMPDEFTAFPLRKDYPLRGRGERHNFPASRVGSREDDAGDEAAVPLGLDVLTHVWISNAFISQVPDQCRPTCSTIPNLPRIPSSLLGPSTSGLSTPRRTRHSASSSSWMASGSSRRRPTSGTCIQGSRSSANT